MSKSEYQKVCDMKKKAKESLYKVCWPQDKITKPLVLILAPKKNEEVLFQVLQGCMILPSNFIVVSEKEQPDFVKHPAGKITWVNPEDGRNQDKINDYILAADMAVLFEEHHGDIQKIMTNGTVAIGHEKSPFLQDYHPNEESGNSFVYGAMNPWAVFMALVRAHETYRFPYDWQNIVRSVLKTKF
jgi:hypothetical protein